MVKNACHFLKQLFVASHYWLKMLSFSLKKAHQISSFSKLGQSLKYILPVSSLHTSSKFEISYKKHGITVTETERSEQDKNPVIVILGWNSSKDKHLAKYSDIFTQNNYGTVRVTANPFNTFFRSGTKVKQIGHNVLKVVNSLCHNERPVFVYAFSNGGCAVFFHMMEALTDQDGEYFNQIQIAGTIFDSCPVNPDIKSVRIVQESVTEQISNRFLKTLTWHSLGLFVPAIVHLNPTVKRYMDGMKQSSLRSPQLVLYSKTDRFAPYEDIDDYVNARRQLGVHVVSKCWEKSGHVNHYREHRDEYLKLVGDFVEDCHKKKD